MTATGPIGRDDNRRTTRPPAPAALRALMHVPVPWVFVLAYLAGLPPQLVWPVPVPDAALRTAHAAGAVVFGVGGAVAAWCLLLFSRARTTTVPGQASNALVTSGPYRYTRNPMYVSLSLMYIGEAGILTQVWPLALLPLVWAYLHTTVIPVEEARLEEAFGDAYLRYRSRVRRWL